jgi:hypothetical protein
MDISATVAPKSDQMNADDLIAGPRTITITRVAADLGNAEQPVSVFFTGDNGKPYKPCKSMRRVMIACWGKMASEYAGRSMTLYRDPSVTWGGMDVGGIRISHMSHISNDMTMPLTATKKARKPYTVRVLKVEVERPAPASEDKAPAIAESIVARVDVATSHVALEAVTGDDIVVKQRAWLAKNRPELATRVDDAVTARLADFDRTDADESIPA